MLAPIISCAAHPPRLLFSLFVCVRADHAGKFNSTPLQISKMSSHCNATVFFAARGEDWVINLLPQNVSPSGVGLFSQVRANFSPQVQSSVLFTRRNPQRVLGAAGSMAAFLETGKQMFTRQSGRVTSAYWPRCLHDTAARSADCGPKKPNGGTIHHPRCQKTINAPPQGKHSSSSWIHTGEAGRLQSGPASAK